MFGIVEDLAPTREGGEVRGRGSTGRGDAGLSGLGFPPVSALIALTVRFRGDGAASARAVEARAGRARRHSRAPRDARAPQLFARSDDVPGRRRANPARAASGVAIADALIANVYPGSTRACSACGRVGRKNALHPRGAIFHDDTCRRARLRRASRPGRLATSGRIRRVSDVSPATRGARRFTSRLATRGRPRLVAPRAPPVLASVARFREIWLV